jgi:hypothetical protein
MQVICRRNTLTLPSRAIVEGPGARGFRQRSGSARIAIVLILLVVILRPIGVEHLVAGDGRPARQVALHLPRLQGLQSRVEHPRNDQRLVGGDLAGRHRQQGRVERRHDITGPRPVRHLKRDRPAARPRRQMADDEASRHRIAVERLVDDDAGDPMALMIGEGCCEHRCTVGGTGHLTTWIAGLTGEPAAGGIARNL